MPKVVNKLEKITLDTTFESFMRRIEQYRRKSMLEYKGKKYDSEKVYSKMLTAYIEDFNNVLTKEVLPAVKGIFDVGEEEGVIKDVQVGILTTLEEARKNNVLDEGNFLLLQVLIFDFDEFFFPVYLGDFKSFSNLLANIEEHVMEGVEVFEEEVVKRRGFSRYGTVKGRNFGYMKN